MHTEGTCMYTIPEDQQRERETKKKTKIEQQEMIMEM